MTGRYAVRDGIERLVQALTMRRSDAAETVSGEPAPDRLDGNGPVGGNKQGRG
jgi:hypothetical protein